MALKFKELPGWDFVVDEISAGIYNVRGNDEAGRSIEKAGENPDALLDECKKYAAANGDFRRLNREGATE